MGNNINIWKEYMSLKKISWTFKKVKIKYVVENTFLNALLINIKVQYVTIWPIFYKLNNNTKKYVEKANCVLNYWCRFPITRHHVATNFFDLVTNFCRLNGHPLANFAFFRNPRRESCIFSLSSGNNLVFFNDPLAKIAFFP